MVFEAEFFEPIELPEAPVEMADDSEVVVVVASLFSTFSISSLSTDSFTLFNIICASSVSCMIYP